MEIIYFNFIEAVGIGDRGGQQQQQHLYFERQIAEQKKFFQQQLFEQQIQQHDPLNVLDRNIVEEFFSGFEHEHQQPHHHH